ncbi:Laccase TilA [Penicillium digitatum Pd1]|uniref:Laccase TilA n=1 Tax=Penicillium digitatum (strain Pd1 / CECT 20795) TaxID=1170230 RepID=K9FSV2_PEND1|nr:Laccase TilA [Penicillium digitatum Pd1]EKV04161.1 Laccase TilA [Penicillium digitatum Pd1]
MNFTLGSLSLWLLCLVQLVSAATVFFPVTLTWADRTVAGVSRPVISTNGQFPGPPLRINQGDTVEFLVDNRCPFNTTIHFHGIEQLGTPWSDGVPGVSQRSIRPNTSFLYKWTATEYGAYWYHAHHRGSLEDGLYGPIYITPAASVQKPFSLITTNPAQLKAMIQAESVTCPVLLSEWRILTSEEIWAAEMASGTDSFCANALLINGKGSITCLPRAEIDALTTPAQKTSLGNDLRLTDMACFPPNITDTVFNFPHNYAAIPPTMFEGCVPSQGLQEIFTVNAAHQYVSWDLTSTAGLLELTFSIDEHDMWSQRGHHAKLKPLLGSDPPYKLAGDYTVRMVSASINQILNTTAIMRYQGLPQMTRPSNPWIQINNEPVSADTVFLDESQVIPFPVLTPSNNIAQTFFLHINQVGTAYRWRLGNASYGLELEEAQPLLFNQNSIPSDLIVRTKNDTWIDLILQTDTILQPPHPIHKHSNKHFILGQGNGTFSWNSVAEAVQAVPGNFNLQTPQYRDTFPTLPAVTGLTWTAIRYHVVNPGAFLMHCHIQVHQSGGMVLAMLDGVDVWPTVPPAYAIAAGF